MPNVAQPIGAIRDCPSSWNDPKPTENAPLAATIPANGLPQSRPAARQTAMGNMQGKARRARRFCQSSLKKASWNGEDMARD